MKTKTIDRVLRKKLNEWLKTITDETLREAVKANILVSGGSIASMLLKEDVNDYDIYIQDMDVLLKLAEYYCPKKVLDGRNRLSYLERDFPNIDLDNPLTPEGEEYIAERFIRLVNLKSDQIKLDISGAGSKLKPDEKETYLPVFLSQNAISLQNDIQIVLRFSGNAEQIHKTFDFIHATNYFTFKEGLVLNLDAMTSLMTKELKYQGSLYPLTSIIRMKKFISRHWTMNAGEILKILFQVSDLDLRDIIVLEDQLIGVDVAYFAELIIALRGKKREELTPVFISNLIDKIFNNLDEE